jgi:hypothetical protein
LLLGSLCSLAWCAPPLAASCVCCGGAPRDHRLGIHAARLALRLPLLLEAGASVTTVSAGVRQGSRASVGMCARARVCVTSSAVPSFHHAGTVLNVREGTWWTKTGRGGGRVASVSLISRSLMHACRWTATQTLARRRSQTQRKASRWVHFISLELLLAVLVQERVGACAHGVASVCWLCRANGWLVCVHAVWLVCVSACSFVCASAWK